MNEQQPQNCFNCEKALPSNGFFCGHCLIQFKCKACGEYLEKDTIGCINCGAPKQEKASTQTTVFREHQNKCYIHEKKTLESTERTIDASFSDTVAQDLTKILRDFSLLKIHGVSDNEPYEFIDDRNLKDRLFKDIEVIDDQNKNPQNTKIEVKKLDFSASTISDTHPTLQAVVMKNLPTTEPEWVLVYAFYTSQYGSETFTRQDIINMYDESDRKTDQRIKNLTSAMVSNVKKGYLNPLNNDKYSLLDDGVREVNEIINRTSNSKSKIKTTNRSKSSAIKDNTTKSKKSIKQTYKRLTNLNFFPEGNKSLGEFIQQFNPKNDNEKNLLFVHYLTEILKLEEITLTHIYTCHDEIGKIPENLSQSITNTKRRTGWLEKNENSNILITTKGINKIKFWNNKEN